MAIKSTGTISIQDIVDEFGGTGAAGLSEYYRGGPLVPNTNSNSKIGRQGEPIALSQFYGARKEIIMTYTLYGGGGAGGNGLSDGRGSGSGQSGGRSYLVTKNEWLAAAENPNDSNCLIVAAGGSGGGHGATESTTGETGETSDFGAGGTGGGPNSAGSRPTWGHWSAGGGGGGGDNGSGSYFGYGGDDPGASGKKGRKGGKETGTVSLDVDVDYIMHIGEGGGQSSYGSYVAGRGAPGYGTFTLTLDNTVYTANSVNDGSAASHWTTFTVFNLKIAQDGQVLFYPITQAAPLLAPQAINSLWETSGANETDNFGNWTYGFKLNSDGTTSKISSGLGLLMQFPFSVTDWLTATGQGSNVGADYEVQVGTQTTGVAPTVRQNGAAAALNVWHSLSSDFEVYITGSGEGADRSVFPLKIRRAGGSTDVDQVVTIFVTTIPGT
jgi:hypothetical protein